MAAAPTSARFIMYVIEWVTSLIAFSCMAAYLNTYRISAFEWLTAITVIIWLFMSFVIIWNILGKELPGLIEGISFAVLAFLAFTAFLAAAVQCNRTSPMTLAKYCGPNSSTAKASVAFTFFLVIELVASLVLAFLARQKAQTPQISNFQPGPGVAPV